MLFALTLSSLLLHMRAVDGGLYAAHLISVSPHDVNGTQTPLQTEVQGLRYIVRRCDAPALCAGTYFDGERLYSVDYNNTALPQQPNAQPYLRALRILGMLEFLSPNFTSRGGMIRDGGTTVFEGRSVRRVYIGDERSLAIEVFVDPSSGLVAGASDIGNSVTYSMLDYRRVGPYLLPYVILRNGEVLEHYTSRQIAPGDLATPTGLTHRITGSPVVALDPQSVTPVTDCTVAGIAARCLIDSGNSGLSMSLELAEQLNAAPLGTLRVSGLGDYATEVVRAGPLRVGNVEFGDADYAVLSDIHRYGYDLVLGADVLAALPVTIDFAHHRLTFAAPPVLNPLAQSALSFSNFVPVVDVTLGTQPASLAIDTGDQSAINLSYAYYSKHPELFKVARTVSVSGVGAASEEVIGRINGVTIGGYTKPSAEIGATRILRGTGDGHIGAGFLRAFEVVLDYARERLQLLPSGNS